MFHPLDDQCPTLTVVNELRLQGWSGEPVTTVVDRDNVASKRYDSTEAVKYKPYFQVLYSIDKCLPLTSCVPSRQPGKFYKILLRGGRVEPYLSDKAYTPILNEMLHKRGKPLLALEDEPKPKPQPPPGAGARR